MKQGIERSSERSLERWAEGPSITASIWRYRWMVLAAAAIVGFAGFLLSSMQSEEYEPISQNNYDESEGCSP